MSLRCSRCAALLQLRWLTDLNERVRNVRAATAEHLRVMTHIPQCESRHLIGPFIHHRLMIASCLMFSTVDAPHHPQSLSVASLSFSSQIVLSCCALELHLSFNFCCVLVLALFFFPVLFLPLLPPSGHLWCCLPLECWRPALCHG